MDSCRASPLSACNLHLSSNSSTSRSSLSKRCCLKGCKERQWQLSNTNSHKASTKKTHQSTLLKPNTKSNHALNRWQTTCSGTFLVKTRRPRTIRYKCATVTRITSFNCKMAVFRSLLNSSKIKGLRRRSCQRLKIVYSNLNN